MIPHRIRLAALTAIVCATALTVLIAQGVMVRTDATSVAAGQSAVVIVRAPAGVPITLVVAGPSTVAPVRAVGTGSEQRITVGPFTQAGPYSINAVAGSQQATTTVNVAFPPSEQPPAPAGNAGQAYRSATDALLEALNGARTGVSRIPGREPTVEEAKRAMDDLQRQLSEIRSRANDTATTLDEYGQLLNQETNASREQKDEFTRLQNEINQVLTEQARQLREFGRDAAAPAEDPCVAAMAASAALRGSAAMLGAMRNGGSDVGRRQGVTPGGDGADWARSHVTNGRPLRGEGTPQSSVAAWQAMKPKMDGLVASGAAASYGDAERMIDRAAGQNGLGGYSTRQCDKYTGDWSGTTSVEALDKGQSFYQLMNDWTAHVEIAATRTAPTGGADKPIRGTLTGRGTNFKVVNNLRTLYAGRPAQSIQYLTSDPTPAQTSSATFVTAIEGFVRGNQMTLKIRPGGVDYAGRVTGKLAAVVIPMASPVPLVQTYDVVFQGGNWQLMRAIGPNGMAERPFPITVGGDKRIVQAEFPRQLNATGARGDFTIKIRLCAGCE